MMGESLSSGLIAFNWGDAIGENGFACVDNSSIGVESSGLNKLESRMVSSLGVIILSIDCLVWGGWIGVVVAAALGVNVLFEVLSEFVQSSLICSS